MTPVVNTSRNEPHMPSKIAYSPLALSDLDATWNYLGVECENEIAANKAIDAILNRIDMLGDFSESGTPLDARCIIHSDYRFIVSEHYLAFYRNGDRSVYIDRVMDGRNDYLGKLFGIDDSVIDLYV